MSSPVWLRVSHAVRLQFMSVFPCLTTIIVTYTVYVCVPGVVISNVLKSRVQSLISPGEFKERIWSLTTNCWLCNSAYRNTGSIVKQLSLLERHSWNALCCVNEPFILLIRCRLATLFTWPPQGCVLAGGETKRPRLKSNPTTLPHEGHTHSLTRMPKQAQEGVFVCPKASDSMCCVRSLFFTRSIKDFDYAHSDLTEPLIQTLNVAWKNLKELDRHDSTPKIICQTYGKRHCLLKHNTNVVGLHAET